MNPLKTEFPEVDLTDLSDAMMMNENILLRMYPKREESEGGIALTEGAQEKRTASWILSMDEDICDPRLEVGRTVLCPTAALMNPLPELDGRDPSKSPYRYVLMRDVVLVKPAKE